MMTRFAARESDSDGADAQSKDMGEHVPCITEKRKAPSQQPTDDLYDHADHSNRQRKPQPLQGGIAIVEQILHAAAAVFMHLMACHRVSILLGLMLSTDLNTLSGVAIDLWSRSFVKELLLEEISKTNQAAGLLFQLDSVLLLADGDLDEGLQHE